MFRHAVAREPRLLAQLKPCHQADPDIVQEAVMRCGDALQFACKELQANHELVLAAVEDDGSAL